MSSFFVELFSYYMFVPFSPTSVRGLLGGARTCFLCLFISCRSFQDRTAHLPGLASVPSCFFPKVFLRCRSPQTGQAPTFLARSQPECGTRENEETRQPRGLADTQPLRFALTRTDCSGLAHGKVSTRYAVHVRKRKIRNISWTPSACCLSQA